MLGLYSLSVIIFFSILAIVLYKERKKLEIKYYLLFFRRTDKFRKLIDRIANISPRFWKGLSFVAIIGCFVYLIYGTYMILNILMNALTGVLKQPGFQFILPSLTGKAEVGSGYIQIPFWTWMLIIFSILVPHELSHGIISRAYKIRLKSVGLMLFLIAPVAILIVLIYGILSGILSIGLIVLAASLVLPGAFVEPDEKQLNKAKILPKLSVFAAGSAANFLVAFIIFALLATVIWPAITYTGMNIVGVNDNSPAFKAGLRNNTIVTHIDGKPLSVSYCEYNGHIINFLVPGIDICKTGSGYFADESGYIKINDTEIEGLKRSYIGITYSPIYKSGAQYVFPLTYVFGLIWLFSFAVGLFNLLPIYPLDGGLMVGAVLRKYLSEKRTMKILKIITLAMLIFLIVSYVYPVL